MRHASAPPLSTRQSICLNLKDASLSSQDSWNLNEKQTIEFGPWNSQEEQINQYLDVELSLSKYNRGFLIKNEKQLKKKQSKRYKKRNLSQKNQRYFQKTSPEKHIQLQINEQQMQLEGLLKNKRNENEKYYLKDDRNIISSYENSTVKLNKTKQYYIDSIQAKNTFLSPLQMSKQFNENSRTKKQYRDFGFDTENIQNKLKVEQNQQGDIRCDTEPISYKFKTEPSSYIAQSPPHNAILETTILQQKYPYQKKTIILPINTRLNEKLQYDPKKVGYINNNVKQTKYSEQQKEMLDYSDYYNRSRIKNMIYQNNILNKFKDIQNQSHSIEEDSSSSSISTKECSKNQIITSLTEISQIKKMGEFNLARTNKKIINHSLDLTSVQSSPIRMKYLFQISATNDLQKVDSSNDYERRLKTEDRYQRKCNQTKINNQKFLKQYITNETQQQQNIFTQQQNCENNKFNCSISPINTTNQFENENSLQLSQNHLRRSHYQVTHFNKNQSSTQPTQQKGRNIQNEISISSNSNDNYNFCKDACKSQAKNNGLQIEGQNQNDKESQHRTTTIQIRKNILKSCLEDCKLSYDNKKKYDLYSQDQNRYKNQSLNQILPSHLSINHSQDIQNQKNNCNHIVNNTNESKKKKYSSEITKEIVNSVYQNMNLYKNNQQGCQNNQSDHEIDNQNNLSQNFIQPLNSFKVPHNITFGKMKMSKYSIINDQFLRKSCSPTKKNVQKQINSLSKSNAIEKIFEQCQNEQEVNSKLSIIQNQLNNLPIINIDYHPNNYL